MTDAALAAGRRCDWDNWVDRELGVSHEPSTAFDPFGWLLSSAAAFLIEHVQPFREVLASLTVNPAAIRSYAQDWDGISASLVTSRQSLMHAVATDTATWHGAAADSYRRRAAEQADALSAAAIVADAMSSVVVTMGQVVEFVREEVHRLVAELVRQLISWVEEGVFTFGLALPFVAAQAAVTVAEVSPKINDQLGRLNDTLRRVEPALGALADVFADITERLGPPSNPATDAFLNQIPEPPVPHDEHGLDDADDQHGPDLPASLGAPIPAWHDGESTPSHARATPDHHPSAGAWSDAAGRGLSWGSAGSAATGSADGTSASGSGPASVTRATQPFEQPRTLDGPTSADPAQARPSNTDLPPLGTGGTPAGQPGRGGGGGGPASGRRAFGAWTGTPGGPGAPAPPADEHPAPRRPRSAANAPGHAVSPRTLPQSESGPRGGQRRPNFGDQTDDELYEFIGAFLRGSGTDESSAERDRSRHKGRTWLDGEQRRLWQQIHDSETYRAWLESAGTGQVIDQDTLTGILRAQGAAADPAAALAELLVRTESAKVSQDYDIAVSFATEQRDYVERTVAAARALGLLVFYDRDMSNAWWGSNFLLEQRKIYGQRALHFVPFISTEYLAAPHPLDQFSYAMMRAIERRNRYILPVLVGSVVVPPEMLHPHVGYLRAEEHTPEQLAAYMKIAVDSSRTAGRETRDVGIVVHDAHVRDGGSS
ncbi:MAG: hypothetical protein ACJ72N_24905 [Labedaea sp.]